MDLGSRERNLALVIDGDAEGRQAIRRMLGELEFDVVQASNGLVGLELIQRLPQAFRVVLTDLDLPGIPGSIIIETLRIFRPELPVLCMGEGRAVGVLAAPSNCLSKPIQGAELGAQVRAVLSGAVGRWEPPSGAVAEQAVVRARARYEEMNNLVDAAIELARGFRGE